MTYTSTLYIEAGVNKGHGTISESYEYTIKIRAASDDAAFSRTIDYAALHALESFSDPITGVSAVTIKEIKKGNETLAQKVLSIPSNKSWAFKDIDGNTKVLAGFSDKIIFAAIRSNNKARKKQKVA